MVTCILVCFSKLFYLPVCLGCLTYLQSSFLLYLQNFRGLSFPTISSVGPNAAIIHYSPQAETCAEFDPDSIYLFDSGAQVCQLSWKIWLIEMTD